MGPGSAEIPSTSWHSQRFDRLNPPGREGQFESPKLGRFVSNFRIFGAKNPSLGGDQFLLFLSLNFRTLSPNQIVLRFQEFLWVVLGALTYPFHHQTDQLNQHQRGTFPRSVAWCWDGRGVHCRTERTASTQGSVYKVWSSYQSASSWSSRWLGGIKSSSCKVSGQRRCTLDWYNAHLCVCVITSLAHEMTHQTRKCINYVPWNPPFFAWRHCCSFVLNQLLSWKGSDTLKQQFLLITKYTVCSFATHWGDEMNLMFQV